jgi:transcriptional regulator with XRE-family HTH domain
MGNGASRVEKTAMKTFAQRIRHVRGEHNVTDFARMLCVHRNTVMAWERGESFPSVPVLMVISRGFMVDLNWLVLGRNLQSGVRRRKMPSSPPI